MNDNLQWQGQGNSVQNVTWLVDGLLHIFYIYIKTNNFTYNYFND
ncbi:hypothetical protein PCC21_023650 [Pectobacterium carotovorum subsp. carotovorum PCC21]|nr:hypothetical protein PCC21_023650 [Pectobacterium carotovorum subsp. carotovorum PCC21]